MEEDEQERRPSVRDVFEGEEGSGSVDPRRDRAYLGVLDPMFLEFPFTRARLASLEYRALIAMESRVGPSSSSIAG